MSRRGFLGLLGCGLALLLLTASGLYAQERDDIAGFAAVALTQGAVYLVALWLVRRGAASRRAVILILAVAATMRIVVLGEPPSLSSDVYRYVWDGRVIAAGINPYRYIPADPHLAPIRSLRHRRNTLQANSPPVYTPTRRLPNRSR